MQKNYLTFVRNIILVCNMTKSNAKTEKAGVSREKILDAAATQFRKYGYAAVSLRAIASASGMKAGSLYYHFASKEEIVVEVLNLGIDMVQRKVEKSTRALPVTVGASQLVRTGIISHFQALFQFSAYTSANVRIYSQVPESVRMSNLFARRRYETLWEHILERAIRTGEVRSSVNLKAYRLLLIGSINATLEWFKPDHGDVNELANDYADILLNGLSESSEGHHVSA